MPREDLTNTTMATGLVHGSAATDDEQWKSTTTIISTTASAKQEKDLGKKAEQPKNVNTTAFQTTLIIICVVVAAVVGIAATILVWLVRQRFRASYSPEANEGMEMEYYRGAQSLSEELETYPPC